MNKVNKIIFSVIGLLILAIGTGVVFSALNKDPIYSVMEKEDVVSAASAAYTTTEKGNFDENTLAWLDDSWVDEAVGLEHYIDYLNKFNSGEEVIVAVIDSGICTQNPLFKDRIVTVKETKTYELKYTNSSKQLQTEQLELKKGDLLGYTMWSPSSGKKMESLINYSEYPYNTNPNIISDYKPYSFEDDRKNGHGTSVSSVIASLTPKNVKILPIKRQNQNNEDMQMADIVYGVFELIKQLKKDGGYNIVAINMSFSFSGSGGDMDPITDGYQSVSQFLGGHIKDLKDKYNILTCVAAGNYGDYINDAYKIAGCDSAIVCGMLEELDDGSYMRVSDKVSSSGKTGVASGYGDTLDFMAPGWLVNVADFNGTDKNWLVDPKNDFTRVKKASGTSFATPCISALIALLACDENYYNAGGDPVEGLAHKIEQRLRDSAIDELVKEKFDPNVQIKFNVYDAPGVDEYYGYGMANLANHQIEINYETTDVKLTYDGEYHDVIITPYVDCEIFYSLTENGEYNITDITKVDAFKNATQGKKPIYFKLQAKDDVNNYYFKETKGVAYLTINPIELDAVTLIDQTIAYGGLDELDHTQYEITTMDRVLPGDENDFCMGSNATNTTGIGEYELFVASRSGNYKINSNKKKLTIVKRDVTIQLGTTSSNYGSAINLDNYTYEVVSGEVKNEEFLKLNLTTNADSTSIVGSYELNGINLDDNYNVTIQKGEHIITPKRVVIQLKESTT